MSVRNHFSYSGTMRRARLKMKPTHEIRKRGKNWREKSVGMPTKAHLNPTYQSGHINQCIPSIIDSNLSWMFFLISWNQKHSNAGYSNATFTAQLWAVASAIESQAGVWAVNNCRKVKHSPWFLCRLLVKNEVITVPQSTEKAVTSHELRIRRKRIL